LRRQKIFCFLRFGRGGGDRNYQPDGNKGVLRSTLAF
jgi:hypothetical protein